MKPEIDPHKIVVLSGAGISAESGLATFRDAGGLWNRYPVEDLASLQGWQKDPALVLAFYNQRRLDAWRAQPNAAHLAVAQLEEAYEVVVITQNVDSLHERAGSSRVIHLHGELAWARGSAEGAPRVRLDDQPIELGQCCERGSQLRPDIVWFGEAVRHLEEARREVLSAGKVLVVGTSMAVQPAAGLVDAARWHAEKILIDMQINRRPRGFRCVEGKATVVVPRITAAWRLHQKQSVRLATS